MLELALLIDNNSEDNIAHKELILQTGLAKKVLIKNTGKEAINFLTTNPEIPDLIFLDINMPIVDGVVFIHEFENLPEIITDLSRIFVLSNQEKHIDLTKMMESNRITGVLNKPLSEVDCRRILELVS